MRPNRVTLYSQAMFDFDAGPVTITLSDAGKQFMSPIMIDQNQYTPEVVCDAGRTVRASYWDAARQKKVRVAPLSLGETLPDSKEMFGTKDQVDPVRRLIGSAMARGGNPASKAAPGISGTLRAMKLEPSRPPRAASSRSCTLCTSSPVLLSNLRRF